MRVSHKNIGGSGGDGDDPNKNNWNWLNQSLKKKHGESDQPSDIQNLLSKFYENYEKTSKMENTNTEKKFNEISNGLDETLKRFDINVEKLRELSISYEKVDAKVDAVDIKIDNSISNLHEELEQHRQHIQNTHNNIDTNLRNFINLNNDNIVRLQQDFDKIINQQREETLQSFEDLKKNNTEKINNEVNNIRSEIDNIVLNSINNGLSRLINFILTFGGLFDTRIVGYIIITILLISAGILILKNRSQEPQTIILQTTAPVTAPSIELPIQQSINAANPQNSINTELSETRGIILKFFKLLNKWLKQIYEKQLNKLERHKNDK